MRKFFRPKLPINKVIFSLIFTDGLVWAGYWVNNAIAAVYLQERIGVNAIQSISLGYAIFMLTRGLLQIPIARLLDKFPGFVDEGWSIILGGLFMGSSIFSYLFISEAIHLYLVQFLFGLGAATYLPAWRKTFATYLDKGKEGSEYALFDATSMLVGATMTVIGGSIVQMTANYDPVFISTSLMSVVGISSIFILIRTKAIQ